MCAITCSIYVQLCVFFTPYPSTSPPLHHSLPDNTMTNFARSSDCIPEEKYTQYYLLLGKSASGREKAIQLASARRTT